MHGAHAALLQGALEAEVEVRGIDADEDVGLPGQQALAQARAQAQQPRQVAQHFRQPHHRQFAAVVPGLEAGGAHARTTDAGELRVRKAFAQGRHQPGAEQVARGLAGDEGDARRARAGHRASAVRRGRCAR